MIRFLGWKERGIEMGVEVAVLKSDSVGKAPPKHCSQIRHGMTDGRRTLE